MSSSNPAETAPTSRATPATSMRNLVRMERMVIALEHLVGGLEDVGRNVDLEAAGDLLVDHQLRPWHQKLDPRAPPRGQPGHQLPDLLSDRDQVGTVAHQRALRHHPGRRSVDGPARLEH